MGFVELRWKKRFFKYLFLIYLLESHSFKSRNFKNNNLIYLFIWTKQKFCFLIYKINFNSPFFNNNNILIIININALLEINNNNNKEAWKFNLDHLNNERWCYEYKIIDVNYTCNHISTPLSFLPFLFSFQSSFQFLPCLQ